jgi:hypothetical protein
MNFLADYFNVHKFCGKDCGAGGEGGGRRRKLKDTTLQSAVTIELQEKDNSSLASQKQLRFGNFLLT